MKALLLILPLSLCAKNCSIELDIPYPCILEATGNYRILYNNDEDKIESRFSKKAKLEHKQLGLYWGEDYAPYDSFKLFPLKDSRILINGLQYPGSFEFTYGNKVINHVDVDFLVQSIMEKQDFSSYSLEALKALACVIRTDLLFEGKVISADEIDYEGSSMLFQYPKIAQAVIETKNKVMTLDGNLFPTTYSKDSGGVTANLADIFRQNISAPEGKNLPEVSTKLWQKKFSKQELLTRLQLDSLKQLSFYKDKKSEKVYAVKIDKNEGSKILLAEKFMQLLELESNHFALEATQDNFTFKGKGQGLGVGLCLKTSQVLAEKGLSYENILNACYSGIKITLLDN
jgi:SpoIID/LytB domain protein